MALRLNTAPNKADNPSDSSRVICSVWLLGVRRTHVGQSHLELTKQAGYTSASQYPIASKTINPMLHFTGSPYTWLGLTGENSLLCEFDAAGSTIPELDDSIGGAS
jgi:hypothetical protein